MSTRRIILALGLLATGSAAVDAQVGGVKAASAKEEAAIQGALAADRTRFEVTLKADAAGLDRVLADELTYCHSSGRCDGKKVYIDSLVSGRTRYITFVPTEQKARLYGELILINGKARTTVVLNGTEMSFELGYTDAFVRREGRYQMVAWQSTRLPAPDAAK